MGFVLNQPNQAKVLILFGKYHGSIREDGFFWANPLAISKKLSMRVINFQSDKLKVNDSDGNPIEIAAVVVWRVVDTAKALFDVEDFQEFVSIQSETAIRTLASRYPYDAHNNEIASLRGAPEDVVETLKKELQERLDIAGVEVLEARISHLAYAPEIAQAMLRRQQAQAIIAARQQIVEGAIGMVQMALAHLEEEGVVELDEERKASMVNNLLVTLVSEGETHPVINTGSLYS
jgi:regulator of protease activity HflC (stomatin/prohibitin superfamily)